MSTSSATAQVHTLPGPDEAEIAKFLAGTVQTDIHIVIIPPDDGPQPYGRWFGDDADAAAAWAATENRKRYGAYWTVNIVRQGLNKKPSKPEMVAARFCHVDLDPPKDGSPWDREGKLAQLAEMRVPPTFINDSGGGLQAFWRLDEIGQNLPAIEDLNKRLAILLGGDHCHNHDRLMRIPGTINWPNELKRKRGRAPATAFVVEPDQGEVVEPEALHATLPPLPAKERTEREYVELEGVELVGLDALNLTTVDPLFFLIICDDSEGRSERVLKVAGLMVRRGFDDATIAGVLLNPALAISAHCFDQPSPQRPVKRALGKAHSDARASSAPQGRAGDNPTRGGDRAGDGAPPPRSGQLVEVSEDAIALAFTEVNRERLRFDHDAGRWYEWDETRWKRDGKGRAFHYARELGRRIGDGKKQVCKASVAAGAERFARCDPAHAVETTEWDNDTMLLGTPSGTVDLRTGRMRRANPADLITKQTGVEPQSGEPTLWLRFLAEAVSADAEVIRFLQQWAGYCLTGETREHALAFVYGPGGNGKSVFLNTLVAILGDYATVSAMETFTASTNDRHSTELAMLRGARLVTASETEENRAWAEAKVKQMTGGDPITARFMRQDNFTFRPQFKLTIAGNHAPALSTVDDAMRRRLNVVPFVTKPSRPDPMLEKKLEAEHGRILAWAIAGCLDWQEHGLVRPEAVKVATADYFEDQDLFGQWVEERCVCASDKWELPAKLYASWNDYVKAAGDGPGSMVSFSDKLKRRGFIKGKTGGLRVYRGLALSETGAGFHE